jgi:predicted transcriptional regulator
MRIPFGTLSPIDKIKKCEVIQTPARNLYKYKEVINHLHNLSTA